MSDQLIHYSRLPVRLETLERREQPVTNKPKGLWVSDGTAWKDWCESENFEAGRTVCANEVTLAQDARILRIESETELDDFTDAYAVFPEGFPADYAYYLDWPAVAAAYSGVLIIPYLWSRHLDASSPWYYGWDVASGCIWEPTAVASIRRM
jgi:hypothetical protein